MAFKYARASSVTLSNDITSSVPACALQCFESFIDVNYTPGTCGSSPSLQCLCAYNGSQGFTLGEGAVQCLIAEDKQGGCQGDDAGCEWPRYISVHDILRA